MEKSEAYTTRQNLINSLQTPTIGDAKRELGEPLANLVFQECPEVLKEDLGLEPPLNGPGDMLWTSPSDLLIGKVCLKPPLTQKHLQALTHQGILEIGYQIEQKFWNEMRIEKEKALKDREDYLMRMFEVQKNLLINKIRAEQKEIFQKKMDCIHRYYQQQISELLYDMANEHFQIEVSLTRFYDHEVALLKEKLKKRMNRVVKQLTEKFLEKLAEQEVILTQLYTKQIGSLKSNRECAIEFERSKGREALKQLRHQLHCENIANLMYILCKERQNCQTEREKIEHDYQSQIKSLKHVIRNKTHIVSKLKKIREKKINQVKIREKCLVELIYQFRKLIYLAIQATPTQGEFLLSIQRMMNFELENYCIAQEKDIEQKAPKITEEIKEEVQEIIETQTASENQLSGVDESGKHEIAESDALPAMYFNNKMYVREDFRDMVTTGLEIRPGHPLWNRDVDELIKIMKKSVKPAKKKSETKQHEEVRKFSVKTADEPRKPPQSTAGTQTESYLTTKPCQFSGTRSPASKEISIHETELHVTNIQESESQKHRAAHIILDETSTMNESRAMSQVSLQLERKSVKSLKSDDRKKSSKMLEFRQHDTMSKLTLARDSIILRLSSFERKSLLQLSMSKQSSLTADTESLKQKPEGSKLLAACDSLEVIKSQSKAVFEPLEQHQPRDRSFHVIPKDEVAMKKAPKVKPAKKKGKKGSVPDKSKVLTKPVDPEDFTKRVNSLLDIMKRNPSLMALFTSGGGK